MKKVSAGILGVVFMGLLIFNYTSKTSNSTQKSSFLLNNIQVMQASADDGTYNCDQNNPNCCSYPGMNSNGVLTYTGTATLTATAD